MKVKVINESVVSKEAESVQNLIDDGVWKVNSSEVSTCKKYMKLLGANSLNDVMTVSEDEQPSSYNFIKKLLANKKASKDISSDGIGASLYEFNGIKVIAENTDGYYSFYFSRKDMSSLK